MFVFFRQFLGPIVGGALVYGLGFRWMTGVRPLFVAYQFLISRAGMNVHVLMFEYSFDVETFEHRFTFTCGRFLIN